MVLIFIKSMHANLQPKTLTESGTDRPPGPAGDNKTKDTKEAKIYLNQIQI